MPCPIVTGIAPKDGQPGTRVTIRGENLGNSQNDLCGVAICRKNCTMTAEWISSSKIICRTAFGMGVGDIIVITKSGGVGTCTVKFTGYEAQKVGPKEVSTIWVDETNYIDQRLDRSQKPQFSLRSDPLGVHLDEPRISNCGISLSNMFPKCSSDPTDENFNPAWFLLENHFDTTFQKLKEGHAYMKRRANRDSNNVPISHVKDSLSVFFEVHDTLSAIDTKMKDDLDGKDITSEVESLLTEASQNANDLFETVLTCKDRADSIRNTLNVLQRFKFLFNLPLNIDRNIHKGDYGVVINDYEKAKSLFEDTDVPIFKKVYGVVKEKISQFQSQLTDEVQQLPLALTRQKTLIRYLIGLEDDKDPAWSCLSHQHLWIQDRMIECKTKYEDLSKKLKDDHSDEDFLEICQNFHTELINIAAGQLSEHWYLWEQYSSGVILSETGEKNIHVEKLKNLANKHTKEMRKMFQEAINLLINLIREAFLSTDQSMWPKHCVVSAEVLADCIRSFRGAYLEFSFLSLPSGILEPFKTVIEDLRVLCLSNFFYEAANEIQNLSLKEDWNVNEIGITLLPSKYNDITTRLFLLITDIKASTSGEDDVFGRTNTQKKLFELSLNLFVSFFKAINEACLSDQICSVSQVEKFIIGISNLDFTKHQIIPNLYNKLESNKFPNLARIQKSVEELWVENRKKLFNCYCEKRIEPMIITLETGMYAGKFNWENAPKPSNVRSYIKLILMKIISLHSEVFFISPNLVKDVMNEVISCVAEEILRLTQCVTNWSPNGVQQILLDVSTFRESTEAFSTNKSKSCLIFIISSSNYFSISVKSLII